MSAVAARKAKQDVFGGLTTVPQHLQPPVREVEVHGVPPPAKKQKTKPDPQSLRSDSLNKKSKLELKRTFVPVPQSSPSSAQSTGSRKSPKIIDEEILQNSEDYKRLDDRELLVDGQSSHAEESEIGDSE